MAEFRALDREEDECARPEAAEDIPKRHAAVAVLVDEIEEEAREGEAGEGTGGQESFEQGHRGSVVAGEGRELRRAMCAGARVGGATWVEAVGLLRGVGVPWVPWGYLGALGLSLAAREGSVMGRLCLPATRAKVLEKASAAG